MSDMAPEILLFARGLVALLDLWPALTIAVREGWGGPDSAEKKTWLASEIIDHFEANAKYSEATPRAVDPASAADPPLDQDQLADMLEQIMVDEFEAQIEDGSIDPVAADIARLWKDIVAPGERTAEETVSALERKSAEVNKKGVQAQSGGGGGDVDEDGNQWESDSEDDDEEDEAPQLVERAPKERQEPVVDDDGFELVQKKGGRR